jgi:type II secretory pathway pseudopilin PulG
MGIMGSLIGAGVGAAGSLLNRGAKQRQAQQQAEMAQQAAQNQFQSAHGGRFGEKGAFRNRLLGNLGVNSSTERTFGAGAPGSAGSFKLNMFDPDKLFAAINAGDFGNELRGTTTDDINKRVDFSTPEKIETGTSFLGDLFSGAAGGIGSGGGFGDMFGGGAGGFPQIPVVDPNRFPGFGG